MSGVSLRANETLEATLDAYGNMILRLAYSCLKSRDDAEDVLQDVMVKLLELNPRFENGEHEKAWLIVTASNTCKDTLRRASRREEPLEVQDTSYFAASANICSFSSRESSLRTVFVLQ